MRHTAIVPFLSFTKSFCFVDTKWNKSFWFSEALHVFLWFIIFLVVVDELIQQDELIPVLVHKAVFLLGHFNDRKHASSHILSPSSGDELRLRWQHRRLCSHQMQRKHFRFPETCYSSSWKPEVCQTNQMLSSPHRKTTNEIAGWDKTNVRLPVVNSLELQFIYIIFQFMSTFSNMCIWIYLHSVQQNAICVIMLLLLMQ